MFILISAAVLIAAFVLILMAVRRSRRRMFLFSQAAQDQQREIEYVFQELLRKSAKDGRHAFSHIGYASDRKGWDRMEIWPYEGGVAIFERRVKRRRVRYFVDISGVDQVLARFPPKGCECDDLWFTGPLDQLFERFGRAAPHDEMREARDFLTACDTRRPG